MRLKIVSCFILFGIGLFFPGIMVSQNSVVIRKDCARHHRFDIGALQTKNDHDPWFGNDKIMHFAGSMMLYTGSYLLQTEFCGLHKPAMNSAGLTLTAGLGKEIYDHSRPPNFFSWKDMLWNFAGVGAGMILIKSFNP